MVALDLHHELGAAHAQVDVRRADLVQRHALRVGGDAAVRAALLHADAQDLAARSDALYGAWLCGTVLGAITMGLHHKLCHTLGGSFNLPHAETHTIVLPHALAYNAQAAPEAMQRIRRALGGASYGECGSM